MKVRPWQIIAILVLAFVGFGPTIKGCDWTTPFNPKADAATYVYEKDDGGVPPAVSSALSKLNESGIVATTFEEDTVDGSGEVPDQYKVPLAEARRVGLPSLVVTGSGKLRRTVKDPQTEPAVLEAVK